MEPIPNVSSRPLTTGRASSSTPLMDIEVYRPSPFLALGILIAPVVVALAGAVISLNLIGEIPVWLPFVLLAWLPGLPIVWLTMQNVRTSSEEVAAGRPWQTWNSIPWSLVERVEQRGVAIRIIGSNGQRLTVVPVLLRDGGRLKRRLLLRLPLHVLVGVLAREAQRLLAGGMFPMSESGLSGTLRAQPQRIWRIIPAAGVVVALGGGALALLTLPLGPSIPLAIFALVIAGAAIRIGAWTAQEVLMNEKGISVIWQLTRRSREMPWAQVELIERSPREILLRLRGTQRLLCAGPALMPAAQRDLMRAFLHEYCVNRDVPIVRRGWML